MLTLTYRTHTEGTWRRVYCPELSVSGAGASHEDAVESLYESARLTARAIHGGSAQATDAEREAAALVIANWNNVAAIFEDPSHAAR